MTIPKKIHYCWFGGNELPELTIQCIESWKKFCPDYEIIRWDESNVDLNSCQFVKEAYAAKQWAFVSDYIRLKVVEACGGIYLDTDVELLTSLEPFLNLQAFMGFQFDDRHLVASGLGFGAIAHHPALKALMSTYEHIPFIQANGSYDTTPCPDRDTRVLEQFGLKRNNTTQRLEVEQYAITIYSSDYFCPKSYEGDEHFTDNTVSVHHYDASWLPEQEREKLRLKVHYKQKFGPKLGKFMFKKHKQLLKIKRLLSGNQRK
ncbi:Glycosyltransferase sugar-binding region containing DXD motif protein [Vibrio aerogenes CECT 7868]|uniref:Glycosyltransferase sugar-binding region containing DXD motif protein n=1 Tax=Vibrio aerogenes CECT 7868 TaxID=1216006 RepID=A0A1M5ZBS6_9VIBR|nr:glycosyltransferase [Vibrio aerogenes]SHI21661.1 Glycosyltransferase sugar-binding region containing DXD motif protein [Vibrio aerogenes CECT 7868]